MKKIFFLILILLTSQGKGIPSYTWDKFEDLKIASNITKPQKITSEFASQLLHGQPVYISLTSIHSRVHLVPNTVLSLLAGTILPTQIFIFLSKEPFLLDKGVPYSYLLKGNWSSVLMNPLVSIIYTENIGPHRKLLPLLSKKWNEDCVIITVDDDEIYPKTALSDLIGYYSASNQSAVVALRTRRMGLCSDAPPWRLAPYPRKGRWPIPAGGRREMLMLPTGIGGVLYRPRFFNKIVFDEKLRKLTITGDDLMFRLSTLVNNVAVVAACTFGRYDLCPTKPRILIAKQSHSLDLSTLLLNFSNNHGIVTITPNTTSSLNKSTNIIRENKKILHYDKYHHRLEQSQSLANNVNNNGGNDNMWIKACNYLKEKGIFDFQLLLQEYAPKERLQCMIHSTSKRIAKNDSSNIINDIIEHLKSSIQSVYDRRCGVQYCNN